MDCVRIHLSKSKIEVAIIQSLSNVFEHYARQSKTNGTAPGRPGIGKEPEKATAMIWVRKARWVEQMANQSRGSRWRPTLLN
jgi:hypothetical protein